MKISTISALLTALVTFGTLFFSQVSVAHHDRGSSYGVNTYVITMKTGLARNYFNYSYDQRRAKNLAKYYRTNNRAIKKLYRHEHSYHDSYHYEHHYDDCPYSDHRH